MPVFRPVQTSFAGGEISPRLGGRFEADLYKQALRFCENLEPTPHGSLLMRAGSRHVQPLAGDARTRLIRYRMVTGQDYLIELFDHVMRLYAIDGATAMPVIVGASNIVQNGDFSQSGTGWTMGVDFARRGQPPDASGIAGDSGFVNGVAHFYAQTGTGSDTDYIDQVLVVTAQGRAQIDFDLSNIHGPSPDSKIDVRLGTTPGGTEVLGFLGVPAAHMTLYSAGDLAPGTYYLRIKCPVLPGPPAPPLSGNTWDLDNLVVKITYTFPQYAIPTPWSADELAAVAFASETGMDRAVFVHGSHSPWFLQSRDGLWSFGDVIFAHKPTEWAGVNWPSVIEIHKGRAYYSGVSSAKNRFWASVAGELFNLNPASGTDGAQLPGDLLDVKVATNGAIRWMKSSTSLLLGTDLGEHIVTGSNGVPLNGDIDVRRESAFGASSVAAVDAGSMALYVSADRKRVRAIDYNLQTSKWESRDVTFVAHHITAVDQVKELHHAWTPDGLELALLDSGKFAACEFAPGQQIAAWWRLSLASGAVRSAAVSQGPNGAFLWLAVERGGAMWLERLPLSESAQGLTYLDASVIAVADGGGNVGGLAHLEGRQARVVADGAIAGDFLVVGGALALGAELAGATVVVGLPYRPKAVTLPKDVRGGKTRSPKIGLLLNDSALPLVNGKRPPDRSPSTPMDTGEPRMTGKIEVASLGWSDEGTVTLEQDVPFRTEILALFEITAVADV